MGVSGVMNGWEEGMDGGTYVLEEAMGEVCA